MDGKLQLDLKAEVPSDDVLQQEQFVKHH